MINPSADYISLHRRRIEFFAKESLDHVVLEHDGTISGHEAMKQILDDFEASGAHEGAPIIFNVTGNVQKSDKDTFLKASNIV
jgi:hypothetical protein